MLFIDIRICIICMFAKYIFFEIEQFDSQTKLNNLTRKNTSKIYLVNLNHIPLYLILDYLDFYNPRFLRMIVSQRMLWSYHTHLSYWFISSIFQPRHFVIDHHPYHGPHPCSISEVYHETYWLEPTSRYFTHHETNNLYITLQWIFGNQTCTLGFDHGNCVLLWKNH